MPNKFVLNPIEYQFKIIHWEWDDVSDWSHEEDVPLAQAGWGQQKEFFEASTFIFLFKKSSL